jgi:hypothetical protein
MLSGRLLLGIVTAVGFHEASIAANAANFAGMPSTHQVRRIANWVTKSNDNGNSAFFVIDKRDARLYVFNSRGRLQGRAPVLLGLARGDDSVPGIGEKALAEIAPRDRTTPAGRFVAERGRNAQGEDIVWVDYAAAISLHRVRPLKKSEHRLERLASPTPADNRISYGCINVPVRFYNRVVQRAWASGGGVVIYVLPEVRPLDDFFPPRYTIRYAGALLRRLG